MANKVIATLMEYTHVTPYGTTYETEVTLLKDVQGNLVIHIAQQHDDEGSDYDQVLIDAFTWKELSNLIDNEVEIMKPTPSNTAKMEGANHESIATPKD